MVRIAHLLDEDTVKALERAKADALIAEYQRKGVRVLPSEAARLRAKGLKVQPGPRASTEPTSNTATPQHRPPSTNERSTIMAASTTVQIVTKANGQVTNASAALLRSKGFAVKNGTLGTEVAALVAEAGKTPTVVDFWALTPARQSQLHTRAKAARRKAEAKAKARKAKAGK